MYSDPNMQSNMSMGYDYRSSSIHFKPPAAMENMSSMPNLNNMNPSFHQHQMYYDNQNILPPPPIEPNSYMPMMPVQNMDPNYDLPRYYWGPMEPKPEGYSMVPSSQAASQFASQPPPQQNVVQRIGGLIKSQLPALQAIMAHVSSIYNQPAPRGAESRRPHSRSRSRSKQRHRKSSDSSHDWLCRKCSFSNYDWRESCKRCYEARPSRNFVPGPEDWKCPKCSNINYARRMECNRCKRPKNAND